jgi:hypothetical protein
VTLKLVRLASMTDTVDELGPVDWIVVDFPGSKFNSEIAQHSRTWFKKERFGSWTSCC